MGEGDSTYDESQPPDSTLSLPDAMTRHFAQPCLFMEADGPYVEPGNDDQPFRCLDALARWLGCLGGEANLVV